MSFFTDNVPSMFGSPEKYDLYVWTWNMSNVWRSNVRVPYLSKTCRKTHLAVSLIHKISAAVFAALVAEYSEPLC